MIKHAFKNILLKMGYRLSKVSPLPILNDNPFLAIHSVVGNSPLVIDVGANHGQTVFKVKQCFPDAKIHCFEPAHNCIEILRENCRGINGIVLNQMAVGETNGTMEFNQYAWSGLNSMLTRTFTNSTITGKYHVPVTNLDTYCKSNSIINIDLLKTDTEGFECRVLRGADGLFKENRIKFVFVELFFQQHFQGQDDAVDVISFMTKHGFDLLRWYDVEFDSTGAASRTDALFRHQSLRYAS